MQNGDEASPSIILGSSSFSEIDGVSPSVFRCTSTPMETGPIDACGET